MAAPLPPPAVQPRSLGDTCYPEFLPSYSFEIGCPSVKGLASHQPGIEATAGPQPHHQRVKLRLHAAAGNCVQLHSHWVLEGELSGATAHAALQVGVTSAAVDALAAAARPNLQG